MLLPWEWWNQHHSCGYLCLSVSATFQTLISVCKWPVWVLHTWPSPTNSLGFRDCRAQKMRCSYLGWRMPRGACCAGRWITSPWTPARGQGPKDSEAGGFDTSALWAWTAVYLVLWSNPYVKTLFKGGQMSQGSTCSLGNYQLIPQRFPEGCLWAKSMLNTLRPISHVSLLCCSIFWRRKS